LSTFSGSIMSTATATPATAAPDTGRDPYASLNAEQRAAVEHDIGAAGAAPLLVVAGAGSGKTNTLAHRVARLIQSGADPQRILLLTFSRRAANEMVPRAGGVLQRIFTSSSQAVASLPWAGTFHSIGARLLREYAGRIGLEASFTIHDRGDSEDLMGMVRQEIGLTQTGQKRFPLKGTCLAIYSRVVNSRDSRSARCCSRPSPGAASGKSRAEAPVRRLRRRQAGAERARLRRPAAVLGRDGGRSRNWGRSWARCSTTCWSTNTRTPTACRPPSCRA
jgi:hypothetical protein